MRNLLMMRFQVGELGAEHCEWFEKIVSWVDLGSFSLFVPADKCLLKIVAGASKSRKT